MGLDMYLQEKITTPNGQVELRELLTWRKANQIRHWFYTHQNRQEIDEQLAVELTLQDLKDLSTDIEKVLKNHALGPVLLPTQSGFFFGSTEYNDNYYNDLLKTFLAVNIILGVSHDEQTFVYSEWW